VAVLPVPESEPLEGDDPEAALRNRLNGILTRTGGEPFPEDKPMDTRPPARPPREPVDLDTRLAGYRQRGIDHAAQINSSISPARRNETSEELVDPEATAALAEAEEQARHRWHDLNRKDGGASQPAPADEEADHA
jgi:hypothetical protein